MINWFMCNNSIHNWTPLFNIKNKKNTMQWNNTMKYNKYVNLGTWWLMQVYLQWTGWWRERYWIPALAPDPGQHFPGATCLIPPAYREPQSLLGRCFLLPPANTLHRSWKYILLHNTLNYSNKIRGPLWPMEALRGKRAKKCQKQKM